MLVSDINIRGVTYDGSECDIVVNKTTNQAIIIAILFFINIEEEVYEKVIPIVIFSLKEKTKKLFNIDMNPYIDNCGRLGIKK